MIVPLIEEEEWAVRLASLPLWTPPMQTMLVVAPHPDDEVLGVGGLIAAQRASGIEVSVVAVTDGENAYADANGAALGALRCREQTAALAHVGVPPKNITRLRIPDSDVMSHLTALITGLSAMVSADTHLLAPWSGDFHPDHVACGLAAEEVAERTGVTLTSYFFWTWHRGRPELLDGLPVRSFPLSAAVQRAKADAICCHRSQLVRRSGEEILPPELLLPAQRPFEVFCTQ